MRYLLLFLLSLLSVNSLLAETIKGRIVDEQNQPMPYVNVVLLSQPDSTFVTGSISREDGSFMLNTTAQHQIVKITSVGYATVFKTIESSDLGTIQLLPDTQLLNEIVVKGSRPVTRMEGDAMVTDIENSLLSKTGSANDVLAKIPGITQTQGGFEVFGKGAPLIYINGRKLRDMSELEQLNSDEIKSIEVVRNPGARYDATVKAVVRIKTRKREGEGFGFDLRSSYYQSENTDITEQANINYRHNNLDVFGSVYFNRTEFQQDYTVDLEKRGTQIWKHYIKNNTEELTENLNATMGFNYQLNDRHYIGAKYQLSHEPTSEGTRQSITDILVNGAYYDQFRSDISNNSEEELGHEANAYYNGQIGSVNIDFNADYLQNGNRSFSLIQERGETLEDRDVHSISDVKNRLIAGKLTVSFPLWKGTLAVGSEMTYTHRNDDYLNEENYVRSSACKINELNATGFAEYNCGFSWGTWTAGLRYEHVKFDYFENDIRIAEQSRQFNNVFPNLSFSTKLGPVDAQLSYTAKTTRPSYKELSNNVYYTDRFTLQKGNPTLRPTLTHDVTFAAAWKWLQFSASYSRTKDWILYWGELIEEDGSQTMLNYRNWTKPIPSVFAFLSASPKIGCWMPMLGIGLKKQWLTVESFGEPFDLTSPVYVASFNNTLELPLGFLISVDANIQSKGAYQNIYLEHPTGSVNASIRKSFLKNEALSIELRGTDLFDTNREYYHLYSGDYNINQENHYDRREFSLTIRYKFNTAKSKYKGTGAGQSQKDRL